MTVWGDDERFQNSYLKAIPGFYSSGDGGFIDDDGYVFVMGRTDDVITWRATACPPAKWKKWLPLTRPSPNAAW